MTTVAQYNYFHSSPLKSEPDTEPEENESLECIKSDKNNIKDDVENSKVKSSLCKNFMNGFCPYGKRCQFAHGPTELRCNKNVNTSYKTKICFGFLKQGHCAFGHRCNYVHKAVPSSRILPELVNNFPEMLCDLRIRDNVSESRLMSIL